MAGMFYSIKEVAEKLGKSEEDVRQLVKAGRLREFRDGPNLLFKVDEVTALMSDTTAVGKKADVKAEEPKKEEAPAEEILLEPEPETPHKADDEIVLTDADTQIVEEGIKVLGETDAAAALKDTGAGDETFKGLTGTPAPGKEASLEEIEKDVSLDTFGSGSGLLDLSLQADDTSLGGILDEIYTTPGGDAKPTGDVAEAAAAGTASSAAPAQVDESAAQGSAMEVAAEADQMEARFPEPTIPMPSAAMAKAYAEPEPDTMSNALGVMLFIPLFAVIYTAIIAIAGFSNIMPEALKGIQGFIWYVAIGLGVASLIILAVGATMGKEKTPKAPKPPKPPKVKKEKLPKPVKENKK